MKQVPDSLRRKLLTGFLFRGLALVLGTGAGLAAAEGGASVLLHYLKSEPAPLRDELAFEPIPVRPDPYLQYRIRPNVGGDVIRTNDLGLRNADLPLLRSPNTLRILILGGSVAWGNSSIDNSDTIAALLESNLNRRFRDAGIQFEVLNGAVPGYVTRQVALAYALLHRRLRPDLVISIDGVNDVYSALLNRKAGLPVEDRNPFQPESTRPTLRDWTRERMRRLKIWRLQTRLFPAGIGTYQAPAPEQVGSSYGSAMQQLAELVARDGGFLQVVLQPMSIFPENKTLTGTERREALKFTSRIPGVETYFRTCFNEIRTWIQDYQREHPSSFSGYDASVIFRGVSEATFVDHCHLTPLGRILFARKLEETTVNWLKGGNRIGNRDLFRGDPAPGAS